MVALAACCLCRNIYIYIVPAKVSLGGAATLFPDNEMNFQNSGNLATQLK